MNAMLILISLLLFFWCLFLIDRDLHRFFTADITVSGHADLISLLYIDCCILHILGACAALRLELLNNDLVVIQLDMHLVYIMFIYFTDAMLDRDRQHTGIGIECKCDR